MRVLSGQNLRKTSLSVFLVWSRGPCLPAPRNLHTQVSPLDESGSWLKSLVWGHAHTELPDPRAGRQSVKMAHSCRWRFPARPGGSSNSGTGRKAGRIRVTASLRNSAGNHPTASGLGPGFDAALQVYTAIGTNLRKFRDVLGESSGSSSAEVSGTFHRLDQSFTIRISFLSGAGSFSNKLNLSEWVVFPCCPSASGTVILLRSSGTCLPSMCCFPLTDLASALIAHLTHRLTASNSKQNKPVAHVPR